MEINKKIKVISIEDNSSFRFSLQGMLEYNEDMECVGAFESAESFLEGGKNCHADVLLLDLNLPGKKGLSLIPYLSNEFPDMKTLILTQDNDYHSTIEAIQLGVSGYILKHSSLEDIERSIRDVHLGGCVIDPVLSKIVLKTLSSGKDHELEILSHREKQVLELLAMGYAKKEIALHLDLSYHTIVEYTNNVFKKLKVPNVAAAVAAGIRKGLI